MVDFQYKDLYGVRDLVEIVRILRAPGGCPWDAEQTHQSIRRNFLEEAYEAAEAIDEGSPEHLKEELGDVLLQVVMHARMEQEAGLFDMETAAICQAAATLTDIPVVVVKMVSDIPEECDTEHSYDEFVDSHSDFGTILDYIENLE